VEPRRKIRRERAKAQMPCKIRKYPGKSRASITASPGDAATDFNGNKRHADGAERTDAIVELGHARRRGPTGTFIDRSGVAPSSVCVDGPSAVRPGIEVQHVLEETLRTRISEFSAPATCEPR
jgi:hypothetical protein